jgi:tetratricopeptide (TPR) repeat protein
MSLDTTLRILQEHQLVRAVLEPEPGYAFKHALTWEAAYQSLLMSKRQEIHREVAECYERMFEGRTDEYAAHLAWHYGAAGDAGKTVRYAKIAGDAALRRSALHEALASYDQALEVGLTGGADNQQLIDIYLGRGRTLELSARHEAAMQNYTEMARQGEERADPSLELSALLAQATLFSVPSTVYKPEEGLVLAGKASDLARRLQDHRAESRALWILSHLESFAGNVMQAIEYGESSLALARQYDYHEQAAYTLNNLSTTYMSSGDMEKSGAALEEAAALWRELGNLPMLTDTLSNFSIYHYSRSEFDSSLGAADEAKKVSESIGNVWGESYGRFIVSFVLAERGELSEALKRADECLDLAAQAGFIPPQCVVQAQIAFILAEAGAYEQALVRARAASEVAQRLYPAWHSFAYANLARCQLAASDVEGARRSIDKAIAELTPADPIGAMTVAAFRVNQARVLLAFGDYEGVFSAFDTLQHFRHQGVRSYLTDELLLRGLATEAMGDDVSARARFEAAVSEGRQVGCRRSLWKASLALGELEARSGNTTRARELRSQVHEIVDYITQHIGDDEIRRAFLSQSEVQKARSQP